MVTLTLDRARRLALAGQGLHLPRATGRVDVRHLRRVMGANHVVQLDSVSVAARAHEMPFWTRIGAHDPDHRDDWLWRSGENVELVAHEQCVVPVTLWPLFADSRRDRHRWTALEQLRAERPGYVEHCYEQVAERGPLAHGDLDDGGGERRPGMWGWSPGKMALAWLANRGRLAIERDHRFQIAYDLVERVLPVAVLEAEEPPLHEARRRLLLLAARANGVGTAADLADHWRMVTRDCLPVLEELADEGLLQRCEVRGWGRTVYRHPDVPMPREVVGGRLLSPFDPVVWFRPRLERLWHVDYRIEIYVPREKRRWGYYVLPFLLDDALVGRVDLKADRGAGVLRVRSAWAEDGVDHVRVARALRDELAGHGSWLGCRDIAVEDTGDLAPALRAAVA